MLNNNIIVPGKLGDSGTQYVYLVKIGSGNHVLRNNIFKIGISTNLNQRLKLLCYEFGSTITLFAYGYSCTPRKTEFLLHSHFSDFHYSFIKEEHYPKLSDEYFKFESGMLQEVSKIFTQFCNDMVIFKEPRPKNVYSGDYEIINGIIIPTVKEES